RAKLLALLESLKNLRGSWRTDSGWRSSKAVLKRWAVKAKPSKLMKPTSVALHATCTRTADERRFKAARVALANRPYSDCWNGIRKTGRKAKSVHTLFLSNG